MSGVPTLSSVAEPIFDNTFVAAPEYGSYVIAKGRSDLIFTNSVSKMLLNPSTDDYQTLLNPDNMRAFYK